jgi:PAS domain S-box-containing protein
MQNRVKNQLFQEAASQLSEAVIITDADAKITWVNPAFFRLSGYKLKECLGKHPSMLLQGKSTDPETLEAIRQAVDNGLYLRTEVLSYHKKGHPYWAFLSIAPIKDPSGERTGFIVIEHDITDEHIQVESMEKQIVEVYGALLSSEEVHRLPLSPSTHLQAARLKHRHPVPRET